MTRNYLKWREWLYYLGCFILMLVILAISKTPLGFKSFDDLVYMSEL